jgi:hypothetical protein
MPDLPDSSLRLFCFGFGYTARALACEVRAAGGEVAGTARVAASRDGVSLLPFDGTRSLPPEALDGVTHLLLSIPPDAEGDLVWRGHAGMIPALNSLVWLGYLSSTSVYGDAGGGWVDETSPLAAQPGRGVRRADAERQWLGEARQRGVPAHVFRLSGMYGAGRNALEQVRNGSARRIFKEGQVFSRIHVEDAAAALHASMRAPNPGAVYNLADDLPAPSWEVVEYACALLGVPPPPMEAFATAELSPVSRSFYAACRRVSNRKIKEELGVRLRYPDYRAGLRALLEAGK